MRSSMYVTLAACLASGCSPSGGSAPAATSGEDHFRCAALISAADQLMNARTVAPDPVLLERGLVASMTHLNAYAIPRHLGEQAAFAAVKAERGRIVASLPPAQIMAQASACVAQVPTGAR